MTEIQTVKGPLGDEQLHWIVELYGGVDPKYASASFVAHQFVGNPFGWSAHTFAIDRGVPVGHTAVVPFRAHRGADPLVAGKIEAVVVAPEYRGTRMPDGTSVAVAILSRAYSFAHECGIDYLFGLAPPRVTAVHARAGCTRLRVDTPTSVLITNPRRVGLEWPVRRRAAVTALAVAQNAVAAMVGAAVRLVAQSTRDATLRTPSAVDAELGLTDFDGENWTIAGDAAWDWYTSSDVLSVLEVPGKHGSRALLRYREGDGASVQIVAWRAARPGTFEALLLIDHCRRLARRSGAPTLRFQPWSGPPGNGALVSACRLAGFARRNETELVLHAVDGSTEIEKLSLTPYFYITF